MTAGKFLRNVSVLQLSDGLEGLSFRRNVHHTWKHNALESALVESPGIGVCKASRSTITGLHCHGRQGAFPGGFE